MVDTILANDYKSVLNHFETQHNDIALNYSSFNTQDTYRSHFHSYLIIGYIIFSKYISFLFFPLWNVTWFPIIDKFF